MGHFQYVDILQGEIFGEFFKKIKSQPLPQRKAALRKIKHIFELFSFLGKMILLNCTNPFIKVKNRTANETAIFVILLYENVRL